MIFFNMVGIMCYYVAWAWAVTTFSHFHHLFCFFSYFCSFWIGNHSFNICNLKFINDCFLNYNASFVFHELFFFMNKCLGWRCLFHKYHWKNKNNNVIRNLNRFLLNNWLILKIPFPKLKYCQIFQKKFSIFFTNFLLGNFLNYKY